MSDSAKNLRSSSTTFVRAVAQDPFRTTKVRKAATAELERRGEGPSKRVAKMSTKKLKALLAHPFARPAVRKAARAELAKRKRASRSTAPTQQEAPEDTESTTTSEEEIGFELGGQAPSLSRWLKGGFILAGILIVMSAFSPKGRR